MGPLLEKLSREKKEIILMGNFNINILNCDSDNDTADFVDTTFASLLYPTINTPTRMDNIFYNDFTKKITVGSLAISISDHLTQFLIIRDQTTKFEDNRKKKVREIRKF